MLALYNTALWLLRPGATLWAAWQRRDPALREEWAERMAERLPPALDGAVWIHGASVGEARVVQALAGVLRQALPDRPLAVSAVTPTGRQQLPAPPAVDAAFFLPLDFPAMQRRLVRRLRPALLALVETELWPNLLREAGKEGVVASLVNARLAPERVARYRRLGSLYRPALRGLARVCAQSDDDAERFRLLGVAEGALRVTGNVKYDLPAPPGDAGELRRRFGLERGRPVLVAGSTRPGEEAAVLDAFVRCRRSFPGLFLVLAPRHVERAEEVQRLVDESGLSATRLSNADRSAGSRDLLLVDTLGQLASLYRLARVAFVGGSLEPFGGHSPLEPAAAGAPVLFGPHTGHFNEPAQALLLAGGARRVKDGVELAAAASVWLADPGLRDRAADQAAGVVAANRGALARTREALLELLPDAPAGPAAGAR